MTNEQQQVREWMKSFGQETPDKPTIPSLEVRKLRAKLILEEALECIDALGMQVCFNNGAREVLYVPELDCYEMHEWKKPNLALIADGCEDLKVVTEGTLVACGLVKKQNHLPTSSVEFFEDPLFNEVMRSNWSKMMTKEEVDYLKTKNFKDLTYKEYWATKELKRFIVYLDGKVIKSPSYSPANLEPIIEEMSK